MKAFHRFKSKFYVKAMISLPLLLAFSLVLFSVSSGYGKADQATEYNHFLTEAENVFLLKPDLVRDVFYGLVDWKANLDRSKAIVTREVLNCKITRKTDRGCKIDRLKREKREKNIPDQLVVPVNFIRISASKYDRRKKLMTLQWQPELYNPPIVKLEEFLDEVYAARESKYYRVKEGIDRIQLNTVFQRDIQFITENAMANSLLGVYSPIPEDNADTITFEVDYVIPSKRYLTMDYLIQLKAVSVNLNHQEFKTIPRIK